MPSCTMQKEGIVSYIISIIPGEKDYESGRKNLIFPLNNLPSNKGVMIMKKYNTSL